MGLLRTRQSTPQLPITSRYMDIYGVRPKFQGQQAAFAHKTGQPMFLWLTVKGCNVGFWTGATSPNGGGEVMRLSDWGNDPIIKVIKAPEDAGGGGLFQALHHPESNYKYKDYQMFCAEGSDVGLLVLAGIVSELLDNETQSEALKISRYGREVGLR